MGQTIKAKTSTKAKTAHLGRGSNDLAPHDLIARQVGGHLALDFCNTAGEHLADRPDELLRDWESFLRWATQVGLIGPKSYRELLRHPEPIAPMAQLREAIYRVGRAIAGTRRVSEQDISFIREHANSPLPAIEVRKDAFQWQPVPSHSSVQLCAVLASEALSLLCSRNSLRIRMCEGGKCGWLFLDASRGKKRRWCDMNDCGSRAKARRYYERHKES